MQEEDGAQEARETDTTTFGKGAVRETKDGVVYVGFRPTAKRGVKGLEVDLNPITIRGSHVAQLLAEQEARGKSLHFLGHVVVMPDLEEPVVE